MKQQHKYILCTIFTIATFCCINAQSNKLKKADLLFEKYFYLDAIEIYESVKVMDENVFRKLAIAYRNTNNSEKSETCYEALSNLGVLTTEDIFNYAQILKMNGKYPEALAKMEQYNQIKSGDSRVLDHLANTAYYTELLADTLKFKVKELAFNSSNDEYGTSYYNAQIVFV